MHRSPPAPPPVETYAAPFVSMYKRVSNAELMRDVELGSTSAVIVRLGDAVAAIHAGVENIFNM